MSAALHLDCTELGDYALLSVTASGGLYASTTRTVAFDPPEWLSERHSQAMQVETSALAATQAVSRLNGTASSVRRDSGRRTPRSAERG